MYDGAIALSNNININISNLLKKQKYRVGTCFLMQHNVTPKLIFYIGLLDPNYKHMLHMWLFFHYEMAVVHLYIKEIPFD